MFTLYVLSQIYLVGLTALGFGWLFLSIICCLICFLEDDWDGLGYCILTLAGIIIWPVIIIGVILWIIPKFFIGGTKSALKIIHDWRR